MIVLLTFGINAEYDVQAAREIPAVEWRELASSSAVLLIQQDSIDFDLQRARDARDMLELTDADNVTALKCADARISELSHALADVLANLDRLRTNALSYPKVEVSQIHQPFRTWGVDEMKKLDD
jgi:hypothetical protein